VTYFCLIQMNILITGSSGLIGKKLTSFLIQNGHAIKQLSTSQTGENIFHWNPARNELDETCLDNTDVVVHLAGANIFSETWTHKRKKEIIDSRVSGIELLRDACERKGIQLKHFISASGVGYYGDRPNEVVTEESSSGNGFAAGVCEKWEETASTMASCTEKISILRIGIVFAPEGGYLTEMKKLSKYKILAPLGSGKQMISWIHLNDLCRIISALIEDKIPAGIYNGVSPADISNKELTYLMNKIWGSPQWPIHVPAFILKLILGERAQELIGGQHVSANKILNAGFEFHFPEAKQAIENIT